MWEALRIKSSAAGRFIAAGLVFALLLSQGLRLCLHGADTPLPGVAPGSHVESTLSEHGGHDNTVVDIDMPFANLDNVPAVASPLVLIATVLILALLGVPAGRTVWPRLPDKLSHRPYLSPPGRAPPL